MTVSPRPRKAAELASRKGRGESKEASVDLTLQGGRPPHRQPPFCAVVFTVEVSPRARSGVQAED